MEAFIILLFLHIFFIDTGWSWEYNFCCFRSMHLPQLHADEEVACQ